MMVTLGEALEMALSAGLLGEQTGGNPALDPGFDEAVSLGEFTAAGVAPAKREKAAGAAKAPASCAGGGSPLKLVVNNRSGRTRPKASECPPLGARPRLLLATVNGVRMDHAAPPI